jgi:hypothetical protein
MVGLSGAIEFEELAVLFQEPLLAVLGGQGAGLLGGGCRVGETTRLGISGGQGADDGGLFELGQLASPFSIFHCAGAIPDGRVAIGRHYPGEIIQGFGRVRFNPKGFPELLHGLTRLAGRYQNTSKV